MGYPTKKFLRKVLVCEIISGQSTHYMTHRIKTTSYKYHLECGHKVTHQGKDRGLNPAERKNVYCEYCESGEPVEESNE
jgi:hypothetical protein